MRGGHGVLPEPIGMLGIGKPKVGVDVDDAGQHEHAAGVHDAGAVHGQIGSDGLDPALAHGHVTGLGASGGHDGAAADHEVGQLRPPR